MEFVAAVRLGGLLIFSFGLTCFLYFWRTRNRFWWRISVFAMSLGITMYYIWFW